MVGRRAGLGVILGAAAAGLGVAYASESVTAAPACAAAPVRWEWNARAKGVPWIAAGPAKSRLEGVLFGYRHLGDGRVNTSEGVVLLARRTMKIAWYSKTWGGNRLTVIGRRLDGTGSFRGTYRASLGAGWYPSGITVPSAGCWELTLRTDGWTRRLVVKAVDPAPEAACDATPAGADGWVRVNPARAGVRGAWPWRTEDGRALLYAGGRSPDGTNAKVLWQARPLGGTLVVSARGWTVSGAFGRSSRARAVRPATGRRPSSRPKRVAGS